ncbi:MAG: DUF1573 domain-containing protein [Pirellulaceae bacterium]
MFLVSSASAQDWAKKMFAETNHDFGTVARGAKSEFVFEFQNIYKETVHVASVRASCGCVTPSIQTDTLETWEKGGIHVKFNTATFVGNRNATITVVIDRPYFAEVQLGIKGLIRSDIVFNPGTVNFSNVDQGNEATQTVHVSYAGRSDWKIVDVRSANTNLMVELNEVERFSGRVGYKLKVNLKPGTPAGFFNSEMILVTNDSAARQVPLLVEGNVQSPLSVSPASLALGSLEVGQKITKNVVVKGNQPFKIVGVQCSDCFEVTLPEEAKELHVVPVQFTAKAAGKIAETIEFNTDLGGATGSCTVSGTVTDTAIAAQQ